MQHSLLVMKAIAQSHAASAVLHLKEPQIFKPFIESFYCERKRNNIVVILQSNLKCLSKEVEKWPLFKDQLACKLHTVAEKALEFLMSQ
jgi:hypothetical protein